MTPFRSRFVWLPLQVLCRLGSPARVNICSGLKNPRPPDGDFCFLTFFASELNVSPTCRIFSSFSSFQDDRTARWYAGAVIGGGRSLEERFALEKLEKRLDEPRFCRIFREKMELPPKESEVFGNYPEFARVLRKRKTLWLT